MANTKLRNIQFYRNGQVSVVTGETVVDLKSAYKKAEQDFIGTGKYNDMLDGEILLYRFSYNEQVHTLVGVVHAPETGTKSLEVLANYDMLGGEISAAIDAALDELDGSATIASKDANGVVTLRAGIKQENGIVSQGEGDNIELAKVATTGNAADVAVATDIVGLDATNVQTALAELQGDIDALQAIDPIVTTVAAGTGISVTSATIEDGNDVTYTVAANFTVDTIKYGEDADDKAGKTYIRIMDGEKIISETDAAAFVKDGFLQEVELIEATAEGQENVLRFTWNSDAGNQVTEIKVSDLCDVYTVGEGLVASEDGFTFSHKAGATGLDTTKAFGDGSVSDNKITVKVPSVTVDKFGHVSALSETEVSLEIPESVASAVQKVTGDKYVTATKNGTEVTLATVTGDVAAGEDKLATAQSVKTYVDGKINALDAEVTSTDGTNVQVKVTEVDGKITAVNVTDNSINATDLKNAIEALDATVRGTSDGVMTENSFDVTDATDAYVAVEVVETDGKLTAVKVKENIDETIQAKITALNADVTSTTGTNVQVQVVETAGVITGVTVSDNSVNANDVATAITTAIEGLDSEVENATGDIKVKVTQVDGELTAVNVTDTLATVAHSGKAADVAIADTGALYIAENVEAALAEVMAKANELDAAQLSAGKGIDINGTTINADLNLSIGNETTGEGESAVTTTYLYIKDTEGNEISKVNANAFVKDGFLQKVEKDATTNELVFTWNSDVKDEEGNPQVTRIAISDLCDVYTAKENDWIQLDGFEFSHKTVANLDSTNVHGITGDITVDSTAVKTFQVPSLKVDAAGHVVSVDEKTVTITLPGSIDTAIQGGAGVDTTYIQTTVARNATNTNQLDVTSTAVIGNYAAEEQVDGLATTTATKTYVDSKINALDESTTILVGGNGISVVDSGTGNDHIYEVNMNGVTRIDNPTADGTAGSPSTSSFADDTTTFTYVKDVKTDPYGRVTGIVTETVTEFFDAGTY